VFVVNMGYELGQRVSNNVLSAVTNDLGEYHIFWLPPGRYYVVTTIYDNVTRRPDVISLDGGNAPIETREATRFVLAKTISSGAISDTEKHVPFFFPATPNWDSAEPIDVLPGAELRDINIDVKTVPSLHIRGIVTGLPPSSRNATAPAAGGIVLLLPQSPALTAFWPDFDQGRTNPDGSFDFSNVSPGLYTLSACQPGCPPVGRVSVEVRDRDVNVTVPLLDSFSVSGRVAIEGGPNPDPRLAALGITLQLDPPLGGFRQNMSAPTATQAGFINPVVHPAADGSFVIRSGLGVLLSGDYRVIVHPALLPQIGGTQPPINLPPGLQAPPPKGLENIYVKSIRMGDRDVLNDGLHLTDQPRDPVLIVIGTNSGALEGRVLDGRHQPVAAATVVLIPESGLRFHINHKNTTTNADGRFQLAAIPPGDYKVFAWEAAETNAWQDPDFVRRYESSATRVHIDEGAKLSLELPSIP
jgi:hypothetical protein